MPLPLINLTFIFLLHSLLQFIIIKGYRLKSAKERDAKGRVQEISNHGPSNCPNLTLLNADLRRAPWKNYKEVSDHQNHPMYIK